MKATLTKLVTALGSGALLSLLTATTASAQHCALPRASSYRHPAPVVTYRSYRAPVARPRIVTVVPSYGFINGRHYGGAVYYENAGLYVRPSATIRRIERVIPAPPRCRVEPPRRSGRRR